MGFLSARTWPACPPGTIGHSGPGMRSMPMPSQRRSENSPRRVVERDRPAEALALSSNPVEPGQGPGADASLNYRQGAGSRPGSSTTRALLPPA